MEPPSPRSRGERILRLILVSGLFGSYAVWIKEQYMNLETRVRSRHLKQLCSEEVFVSSSVVEEHSSA